ncbi:MAG TPA: carboxypeptidase-like regulatory domain-containing protein [Bacteroidales bacterium]
MKKLFLAIILSATFGFGFADNDKINEPGNATPSAEQTIVLTGKVIDLSTNEVLTGVEINIEGTDIKAYSDFDGNFEIKDLKPGEYNIIASFISYQNSLIEKYPVDGKKTVDIKLVSKD